MHGRTNNVSKISNEIINQKGKNIDYVVLNTQPEYELKLMSKNQETDEDFANTLKVCKEINFAKIHVFPFSVRKGTVAAKMPGQINGTIKKQRAKELIELSNKLNLKFNEEYVGKDNLAKNGLHRRIYGDFH